MTEHSDPLADSFAALINTRDDSDWLDVRRRARTPRRWLPILVAAAIAAIAVGSAFALYRELVDFGSADPAPERIQRDFNSFQERTAEASAMFGGPRFSIEGPARAIMTVQVHGEAERVWVAPTREGGFCFRVLGTTCLTPELKATNKIGAMGLATRHAAGFALLAGHVSDERVHQVELLYQDGERVRLPFVWVSAPINAGFYAFDVPEQNEQPGHLTVAITGRDKYGNAVVHTCLNVRGEELARSVSEAVALCKSRA